MENQMDFSSLGTAELRLFYNISMGIMEAEKDGIKIEDIVEACKSELDKRNTSRYRQAI